MLAQRFLPSYNYSDYKTWEGNWELIQGIPFSLLPSPKIRHQIIAGEMHVQIHQQLRSCKDCHVLYETDWIVSEKTVFQPDLMVICKPLLDDFVEVTPNLIVEILSDSTKHKDEGVKYQIYEKQKVKYYVIVDGDSRVAYIYELVKEGYKLIRKIQKGKHVFNLEGCKIELNFKEIWSALSVTHELNHENSDALPD